MADQRRLAKIEKAIAREIASALVGKAADPRAELLISITDVKCSPDLSHARIKFSCLGGEGKQRAAQRYFDQAQGYFTTLVAKRLDTRVAPKLTFHYDESIAKQAQISSLIDGALSEDREAARRRGEISSDDFDSEDDSAVESDAGDAGDSGGDGGGDGGD